MSNDENQKVNEIHNKKLVEQKQNNAVEVIWFMPIMWFVIYIYILVIPAKNI